MINSTKVIRLIGRIKRREFAMASGEMRQAQFISSLCSRFFNLAAHRFPRFHPLHLHDWRHMGEMLEAGQAVYSEARKRRAEVRAMHS